MLCSVLFWSSQWELTRGRRQVNEQCDIIQIAHAAELYYIAYRRWDPGSYTLEASYQETGVSKKQTSNLQSFGNSTKLVLIALWGKWWCIIPCKIFRQNLKISSLDVMMPVNLTSQVSLLWQEVILCVRPDDLFSLFQELHIAYSYQIWICIGIVCCISRCYHLATDTHLKLSSGSRFTFKHLNFHGEYGNLNSLYE